MHIRLADPFVSQDILLAPIYSLALLHTSKPFAYTLHDLQENLLSREFFLVATGLAISGPLAVAGTCPPRDLRIASM